MKILTKAEARKQGYESLTQFIVNDSAMAKSIESAMVGIDAIWIRITDFTSELGRKSSQLKRMPNHESDED